MATDNPAIIIGVMLFGHSTILNRAINIHPKIELDLMIKLRVIIKVIKFKFES
jgi:hypothetical protein